MIQRETLPRRRSKMRRPPREDGRVQFLTYLRPDLVRKLKHRALDQNTWTFRLVEDLLTEALAMIEEDEMNAHFEYMERARLAWEARQRARDALQSERAQSSHLNQSSEQRSDGAAQV